MNNFKLFSEITNNALPDGFGGTAGDGVGALTNYIVLFWRTLIMLGALATIVFLLWGAVDWIMSGGDSGKVESARKKMTSAIIGLSILTASVAIVSFAGSIVGLDLLKIEFPSPGESQGPVATPTTTRVPK